jgi:hypothetical protein
MPREPLGYAHRKPPVSEQANRDSKSFHNTRASPTHATTTPTTTPPNTSDNRHATFDEVERETSSSNAVFVRIANNDRTLRESSRKTPKRHIVTASFVWHSSNASPTHGSRSNYNAEIRPSITLLGAEQPCNEQLNGVAPDTLLKNKFIKKNATGKIIAKQFCLVSSPHTQSAKASYR